MRRNFIFVLLILLFLVGCTSNAQGNLKIIDLVSNNVVFAELPIKIVQALGDGFKKIENYQAIRQQDTLYLLASLGQKNTEGYVVNINRVGLLNVDGEQQIIAFVSQKAPQPSEKQAHIVSYPYTIKKIVGVNLPIKVRFVNANNIKEVISETKIKQVEETQSYTVYLYFGTKDGYLTKEVREVKKLPQPEDAGWLIEELLKGPKSNDMAVSVIPLGTRLLNYSYDKDLEKVKLDFSTHLHGVQGSIGESLALYSIVNTLTEVPGISQVEFLVAGKKVDSLNGHLFLKEPIKRNTIMLIDNKLK